MKKAIFCVIALGMSVATVYGQDEVTAINTGAANFLTIMPDARTAALAGAGVSLTGNENAIFLNGATIAADKNCRGGASYTRMLRGCAIISQVIRCIHWEVFIR